MLLVIVYFQIEVIYCIIGGYSIKIRDAPYHLNYGDVCGAALIHKKWALTTAHCGTNHQYVRVGSTWHRRGHVIKIYSHIIHPKYQLAHQFDYDLQLLKFWRGLRYSKTVKPIFISEDNFGDSLYISGWGYPEEKGEYRETLQQAEVHIVPIDTCQEVEQYWYNYTLTDRMFCAGGWKQDACQGDSGGGAISSSGKLVGLSSFGFGCGRGMPGVYTNLSHSNIRNWIRNYTGI